ncbi:MAG: hypothetical protein DDT34_01705 [Firmicutes bacterium]|nr:hypothetical protein [Bacillota bacterium]
MRKHLQTRVRCLEEYILQTAETPVAVGIRTVGNLCLDALRVTINQTAIVIDIELHVIRARIVEAESVRSNTKSFL